MVEVRAPETQLGGQYFPLWANKQTNLLFIHLKERACVVVELVSLKPVKHLLEAQAGAGAAVWG